MKRVVGAVLLALAVLDTAFLAFAILGYFLAEEDAPGRLVGTIIVFSLVGVLLILAGRRLLEEDA